MIRRGLMDPAMGIGIVEHPLVEEAKRKRDAEALKTSTKTKKTSKKKATKKEA